MQHLDEGILHELLDGEIPSTDLPPIRAHLAACPECRARLEEAREFAGAADQLIETIELTEQKPSRDAVVPPRPPVRRWGRDLAWAASLVMAVGAGYLARGSGRPAAPTTGDSAAPAPAAAPVPPADSVLDRATPSASRPEAAALDRPATPASRTDERERRANAPAPLAQRKTGAKEGAAATPDTAKRRMEDARFALDEIVTTSVPSKAAASAPVAGRTAAQEAAAPPPVVPLAARGARVQLQAAPAANELRLDEEGKVSVALKREAAPMEISFPEALRRLSGTLRLIEGLVPLRLEALGAEVRIIYPLSSGELVLEQWLGDGRVNYRLVAPRDFPTDSLERLRARVRE